MTAGKRRGGTARPRGQVFAARDGSEAFPAAKTRQIAPDSLRRTPPPTLPRAEGRHLRQVVHVGFPQTWAECECGETWPFDDFADANAFVLDHAVSRGAVVRPTGPEISPTRTPSGPSWLVDYRRELDQASKYPRRSRLSRRDKAPDEKGAK